MDTVTMQAPQGVTSASVAGVEYPVDDAGFVDAAPVHLPALLVHGFMQTDRPAPAKPKTDSKPKAE